jgi:hypothetical protein
MALMKHRSIPAVAFALTILVMSAHADRGSIPFTPGVKVFEPTQRAMICWNGDEEILLLTTDLHASAPTRVLEVMPLPAEPKATKGDVEVFRKATDLINRKLRQTLALKSSKSRGGGDEKPAGEITFHEKIGAHDISVAHVLDAAGFVKWVNDYLKKSGVDNPQVPPVMKGLVDEYLGDRFSWFVFDVVSLDEKPKTNEAIQYRFKTDRLFYPMRISRTDWGETSVELLVLTPRLLRDFPGLPSDRIELRHQPVFITADELKSLNEDMEALLGHRDDMRLRIWRIRGDLQSFDADLVAR